MQQHLLRHGGLYNAYFVILFWVYQWKNHENRSIFKSYRHE